jgi:glutathione peroxidase
MKTILSFLLMVAMVTSENGETVYDFKLNLIDGKEVEMSEFKDKVLLIVNTASECGFTPQYDGLQAIYEKYKDRGFYVLGFPANNFGGQEPGTDEEIQEFCRVNFGVEFPLFSRISVKGEEIHPLFEYLVKVENEDFSEEIGWNFEKFLVDRNGNLLRRFKSNVEPESNEIISAVEKAL